MIDFKQPTGDQCSAHIKVFENDTKIGYAIWYPQMGGYCGRAIALLDKKWSTDGVSSKGGCFDVYVWHDGSFPFGEDKSPVRIHHCDPEQFIEFGTTLRTLNDQNKQIVEAL
jgi:hypothetical protein